MHMRWSRLKRIAAVRCVLTRPTLELCEEAALCLYRSAHVVPSAVRAVSVAQLKEKIRSVAATRRERLQGASA